MPAKFYAVRGGRSAGIYHSWDDCLAQVKGFKNAEFKSFSTLTQAQGFLNGENSTSRAPNGKSSKFYGVRLGHVPGVYTDWESAKVQITNYIGATRFKAFPTHAEAEAFVQGSDVPGKRERSNDGSTESVQPGQGKESEREGSKGPANKKRKLGQEGTPVPVSEAESENEPGEGPLPDGAEDGFDPRIILNPTTGKIEYKTDRRLAATKWQATTPTSTGMLRIYTDGSSLGNGARGAVAGVGVYFGPKHPSNVSEPLAGPRQTNQRAELTAILRALEICPRDRPVTIYTDSNYSIKCVTEWYVKWRANGWLNSTRKPVENKDLVEKILVYLDERKDMGEGSRVEFVWVKGHLDNEGNIAADELAVAGANQAKELAAAEYDG